MKKPLLLMILDGFGIADKDEKNAIYSAKTPNIDNLFKNYPTTKINASGMNVGLPEGQMGNSEVGHTNIGAGRIVYQELTRITKAIEDESFFENEALNKAIDNALNNNSTLHIMGLLSDGGVHSHKSHLYALLELAKRKGVSKVFIHAFLDGRDVSPTSGVKFVEECQENINRIGVGKIATIMGRYYAMDRDNRWERVEKAYAAMVYGIGARCYNPVEAVEKSYEAGVTDEFVAPTICSLNAKIKANDSVIFFNFRPDRARELTRAFVDDNFTGFRRKLGFFPLKYVCMTQYDANMPNVEVAFKPEELKNTLGEYLSSNNLKQLRIAETEKYAHVTFFFNGGVEEPFDGEDRILIASPKVATYDLKPEMSAYEVTDKVVEKIESNEYDVIVLNYANCDMVGHTGVFDATVKAVEAVDDCIGKVVEAIKKSDGMLIITADHGNADKMIADDGKSVFTAHTTNPVPLCVIGYDCKLKNNGRLSDIAPTALEMLNLPKPEEMDGESLIDNSEIEPKAEKNKEAKKQTKSEEAKEDKKEKQSQSEIQTQEQEKEDKAETSKEVLKDSDETQQKVDQEISEDDSSDKQPEENKSEESSSSVENKDAVIPEPPKELAENTDSKKKKTKKKK